MKPRRNSQDQPDENAENAENAETDRLLPKDTDPRKSVEGPGAYANSFVSLQKLRQEDELKRQASFRRHEENIKFYATLGAIGKWFFRTMSVISGALKVAHDTIFFIGQVIPPLNAVMMGMVSIVELIEAGYINKEKPGRKTVKVLTSLGAVGFAIPAAILTVNPVTAPIGAVLSAAAIAVTVGRDLFFLHKTQKDIKKLEEKIAAQKSEGSVVDAADVADLAKLTKLLQERKRTLVANSSALAGAVLMSVLAFSLVGGLAAAGPAALGVVGVAFVAAAVVVVRDLFFLHNADQRMTHLRLNIEENKALGIAPNCADVAELAKLTQVCDEKKRTIAVSTAVMGLLAVAVLGLAISNPIGIGIVGVALLAISSVVGAYNLYKKYEEKKAKSAGVETVALLKKTDDGEDEGLRQKKIQSNRAALTHDTDTVKTFRTLFGSNAEEVARKSVDGFHEQGIPMSTVATESHLQTTKNASSLSQRKHAALEDTADDGEGEHPARGANGAKVK